VGGVLEEGLELLGADIGFGEWEVALKKANEG
jgi:hypothetical protein